MLTRYLYCVYTGPVRILNQIPENIFAFESAQCLIGVTAARSVVSWALLKPCQVKSAGQATSRGAEPLGTDLQVNQRSRFPDNLDKVREFWVVGITRLIAWCVPPIATRLMLLLL
ncbi:hypothetical protein TNCV_2438941 [Trichonephila clavipes]|nr:hypothetical protein TNCV_2438941 [Trichonephila clavipes]